MAILTGGCQCGAVRFRTKVVQETASICHCRMCQKAFGNFYAPLVNARHGTLEWTRREPRRFRSSNFVSRGFCETCGTPLTYETPHGISLAIGAFDDPAMIEPKTQDGCEGRIAYVDALSSLPRHRTEDDVEEVTFLSELRSFQHPDHPGEDEDA